VLQRFTLIGQQMKREQGWRTMKMINIPAARYFLFPLLGNLFAMLFQKLPQGGEHYLAHAFSSTEHNLNAL
jgi:hypothetical protein